MNLFALTSIPEARILRFPLSKDLQSDIQNLFLEQEKTFLDGVDTEVVFDGRYKPDDGELLTIKQFEDIDGIGDAVKNPLSIEQFDPKLHSLSRVKAIFTSRPNNGSDRILIQLFESRRLISHSSLAFFFSGNTFVKMNDAGLTLDIKLLAIIDDDVIKFQSFHFLRRIFDLNEYFNEATNEEVKSFASNEKLSVANISAFVDDAAPLIRRKIGFILQSGVLDKFTSEEIVAVAKGFKLEINLDPDGKIIVPSNKTELRRLLRFLDEDYYESPLSQTHFISNSKRVAD